MHDQPLGQSWHSHTTQMSMPRTTQMSMNKQLYENSPVKELWEDAISSGERSALSSRDQLFNQLDPNLAIQHESPRHRSVIWMKARGYSNKEISAATDFTGPWISQILRQPWAREKLLREIELAGRDKLQTIFEGAAADSALKLIELRDTCDDPSIVRQTCVNLLEQHLGKPLQRMESVQQITVTTENIQEIDVQIKQLQEEENRLLGVREESPS